MAKKILNLGSIISPFLSTKTADLHVEIKDGVASVSKQSLKDKPLVTFAVDKDTTVVAVSDADIGQTVEVVSSTNTAANVKLVLGEEDSYYAKSVVTQSPVNTTGGDSQVTKVPKTAKRSGSGCAMVTRKISN